MAYVSGEIKDMTFPANQPANKGEVRAVAFDHGSILTNRIDVEIVGAAGRIEGIENGDGSSGFNQPNRKIASDEAEASGDQYFLGAVLIHTGSLGERTRFHQIFSRPRKV